MKKIFLKTLVGSLVISAILAIFIIITDFESSICSKILLSTLLIFPFSITGLCCSSIYEKPKLKAFSLIGIIINIIGCLLYLGVIWEILNVCIIFCENNDGLDIWQLLLTSTTLSTSFAHISLLLLINSQDKIVNIIKKTTIITSIILDLIILDGIWTQILQEAIWGKIILILIIIIVLGTIVCPIWHNLTKNQKKNLPNTEEYNNTIEATTKPKCPKCNYEIEDNWKFCPNCNNPIEPKEKQS